MPNVQNGCKMLPTRDGFLICPICRRNKRLQFIDSKTEARDLPVYCPDCKNRIYIDILQGQCFESRGH